MGILQRCVAVALLLFGLCARADADGQARFDLPGPKIDIRVTRGGVMLPIASVPNLLPGDQIWLHPDLPPTQSVHYLLIAAFLRGTTNPPPDNWFIRIETWDKKVREEGVTVTVPDEAEQAILFLAPETGGDFATLRSAVKGRPGVFVRASQDLAEAGFEQGRIEKYLAAMKNVPPGDAKALQEHSDLLARTLALKPNPDCYKRQLDQQYTCLTQTGTQTLLDDGHAQSVAEALSNGSSSDFINQASYTQLAGAGTYSAYVGAIVDLVRLTSGLHTAKYQYIPAVAFPPADATLDASLSMLDLRLNTPPSFNNPKSVIVIGLPAVQKAISPPLRPVDPNHISCLLDPHFALPVEGAPLVFSTTYGHDLVLHLNTPGSNDPGSGDKKDILLVPDAYQGGLVPAPSAPERHELNANGTIVQAPASKPIDGKPEATENAEAKPSEKPASAGAANPALAGAPITGTIQGFWGFDHFTGPTVSLQQVPGGGWKILPAPTTPAKADSNTLIVGQPNHLQLVSSGTACIQSIALEPTDSKVDWKLAAPPAPKDGTDPKASAVPPGSRVSDSSVPPPLPRPEPVDLTLNLPHDTAPGSIHLAVHQFGEKDPEMIAATAFVEPARIETLQFHAGDTTAVLAGTGLDQVNSLTFNDVTFKPAPPSDPAASGNPGKTLTVTLPSDAKAPNLRPSDRLTAEVHLRDGRTLPVATLVLPARPAVTILSRRASDTMASAIQLTHGSDLALGSQLVFFLKSKAPFLRTDKIEIATQPDPGGSQPAGQSGTADAAPAQTAESLHTDLTVSSGALVLQDAHTILATFDPLKTFGPSTFGPFVLRPVTADGTAGEWVPLATIVRLPTLTSLVCPAAPAANCILAGSALYLIDSIAFDSDFTASTKVPDGFVDATLSIPHPPAGPQGPAQPAIFFIRLRDDPSTAQQVTLAVQSDSPLPPLPRNRGSRSTAAATTPPSAPAQSSPVQSAPAPTKPAFAPVGTTPLPQTKPY